MIHYFKQGFNATQAACKICEIEGEDVISYRTAKNWFKLFKSRDMSIDIKLKSGRPRTVDFEALRQAIETDPSISTRKLSNQIGPSKDTIYRALSELNKVNKRCREVSHEMTPQML